MPSTPGQLQVRHSVVSKFWPLPGGCRSSCRHSCRAKNEQNSCGTTESEHPARYAKRTIPNLRDNRVVIGALTSRLFYWRILIIHQFLRIFASSHVAMQYACPVDLNQLGPKSRNAPYGNPKGGVYAPGGHLTQPKTWITCLAEIHMEGTDMHRVIVGMQKHWFATVMAIAALGSGPSATAAGPVSLPDLVLDLPAGQACSFPLTVESRDSTLVIKEFLDRNGHLVRLIQAGRGAKLTFTNADTNAQFVADTPGSVTRVAFSPDGTQTWVTTGHNVLILFPTDVPPGPSTTLTVGQVVFTVDVLGVFTVQKTTGNNTDICAALSQ